MYLFLTYLDKKRPKSWSPSSSGAGEEVTSTTTSLQERDPIICHCYTQLAQYFSHSLAIPSHIGTGTHPPTYIG